jgi:hypothetical protein
VNLSRLISSTNDYLEEFVFGEVERLLALALFVPMSSQADCSSSGCREAYEQSSVALAEGYRGCLWRSGKTGAESTLVRASIYKINKVLRNRKSESLFYIPEEEKC